LEKTIMVLKFMLLACLQKGICSWVVKEGFFIGKSRRKKKETQKDWEEEP
jgi:hypothetical protein